MLDSLDDAAVRRWCAAALQGLRQHQHEINELNVYPVPDGDTGTNLVATLASAHEALESGTGEVTLTGTGRLGPVLRRMARGALLGARGNSGVIMSQLLRGLAESLAETPVVRGRALAGALGVAVEAGYAAVAQPVEGTVLSVASAAARGASATRSDDLATVVRAAAEAASAALARTPEQLPALARAGVVDAGGRGLVVLLDALVLVVTGEAASHRPPGPSGGTARPRTVARETGSPEYEYEVQYLLDAPDEAVNGLEGALSRLGDSLVVVGTGGDRPTWNVHVHVNDVGAAIEAGIVAGRPYRIAVTRFADHLDAPGDGAVDPAARAVVAVAHGPGLARLFAAEGAVVVDGGPSHSPSTAEILAAITSSGAGRVVVLPNDPNAHAVAATAAEEARSAGIHVGVVPTRSPVQCLAALAVRDPARRFEDDVIAMAESAGACRYAEVTVASREALTMAGRCAPGDVLAMVDGEVHLIGDDLHRTCVTLVDRLLAGGGELVTLILGADAPPDLSGLLAGHIGEHWPFIEVQAYDGGQPYYPLLVGVE